MPYRATLPVRSKRGAAQWPTNRRMRAFTSSRAAREQPLGTRVRPIPKPPLAGRSSTSRREEQGLPIRLTQLCSICRRAPLRGRRLCKNATVMVDKLTIFGYMISDDRPSSEEEVEQTQCGVSRPILRRNFTFWPLAVVSIGESVFVAHLDKISKQYTASTRVVGPPRGRRQTRELQETRFNSAFQFTAHGGK